MHEWCKVGGCTVFSVADSGLACTLCARPIQHQWQAGIRSRPGSYVIAGRWCYGRGGIHNVCFFIQPGMAHLGCMRARLLHTRPSCHTNGSWRQHLARLSSAHRVFGDVSNAYVTLRLTREVCLLQSHSIWSLPCMAAHAAHPWRRRHTILSWMCHQLLLLWTDSICDSLGSCVLAYSSVQSLLVGEWHYSVVTCAGCMHCAARCEVGEAVLGAFAYDSYQPADVAH
jgi:hypothetical protein